MQLFQKLEGNPNSRKNKAIRAQRRLVIGGVVAVIGIIFLVVLSQTTSSQPIVLQAAPVGQPYTTLGCEASYNVFYTNTVMSTTESLGGNYPVQWFGTPMEDALANSDGVIDPYLSELQFEDGFLGGVVRVDMNPQMIGNEHYQTILNSESRDAAYVICWVGRSTEAGGMMSRILTAMTWGSVTSEQVTVLFDGLKFAVTQGIDGSFQSVLDDIHPGVIIPAWNWRTDPSPDVLSFVRTMHERGALVGENLDMSPLWRLLGI